MHLATRNGAEVSDTLKYLSERIPATFVYAGIDLERQGLFTGIRGSQIAGRFTLIPALPFPLAGEWRGLLATLEGALRLHRHETGTLAGLDRYLHQRTKGMIGSLSHLIRGAAVEAILAGTEQITRKLLDTIDIDHAAPAPARPRGGQDGPPVTAQAAQPPWQPLPVRPRPASGEPVSSYIRRLALANHLRPAHLRHYLKDPATGGIRLGWLAALAGRPETSLQRALAGQQPPGGFPAGNRQKQPPRTAAAARRDPRDRRMPERAAPLWCSFCSRGTESPARLVAGPGVAICADCVSNCTQALAAKASPEIASWHNTYASELLASLPRQQAIALQVEADIQDRIDTLRERGVSWENIGSALGVSRQAAWMRFSGESTHTVAFE